MTPDEWRTCSDPQVILTFLREQGVLSERKTRLFACACCRRIWHLLPDDRSRRAVEVAERYADGHATDDEAVVAGNAAAEVTDHDLAGIPARLGWRAARAADHLLPLPEDSWQLDQVWQLAATAMEGERLVTEGADAEVLEAWSEQSVESGRTMGWANENPEAELAHLLREIYGPAPFRPVALDPAWLTPAVRGLARLIYDDRRFDLMPVLGMALSDAGCTDAGVLGHCVAEMTHVRGCHLIDLLLKKG